MEGRPAKEIWEAALGELQIQVSKPYYRTWLERTVGLSYQDNQFVIGVPNTFVAEYLDQNQRSLIEKTLIGLTQRDSKVLFQVDADSHNSLSNYGVRAKSYARRGETPKAQQLSLPLFNSSYTFDSFIVGSCNRLAHAAAREVAENPGHAYNPLFIYGGAGLGKTHLLHAIGNMALSSNLQVLYVNAEQFTNEFVDSVRQKKTNEFRNKYRSVDMLLIDDIQFIGGKKQTERSFFHTFNELHEANHQIAVTSDCPPKSMPLLEERLRSRFEWGLVADIQPPDLEMRLAILREKAEREEVDVSSDVLEFIAQQIQYNVRKLEGSLNRVIAYAKLTRAPLTPELAAKVLEDIASKSNNSIRITPCLVIETVADSYHLTPQNLISRERDRETALARQVAMYLIKQETNCSLAQIGKEFGGRDHHIVSQAYKKVAGEVVNDTSLRDKISDIRHRLCPSN